MALRIYVAAGQATRAKAAAVLLRREGHLVMSRWHDTAGRDEDLRQLDREDIDLDARRLDTRVYLNDLAMADAVLGLRCELPEVIIGWAQGKHVLIVGDAREEAQMADLPGMRWFATLDLAMEWLRKRTVST